MIASVIRFVLILTLLLAAVFALHTFILHLLEKPLLAHQIIKAYVVNYILAVLIFCTLLFLKKKFNDQLGFIFMAGSLLKFLFFFLLFYPQYYTDAKMQGIEFITFFIPYSVSLITETLAVIKLLNK